ncbi:MAG: flagellar protein FliS [Planctomyces sp.]|nr:flagellar protein FliS [Planctomyces sp.]
MNAAQNAYRRSAVSQWTRIDLLVALYAATHKTLVRGADALDRADERESAAATLRAQNQLLALLDGLQPEPGSTAENVQRLLVYCMQRISARDAACWRQAAEIVSTLRSGFEGICEEARTLEQTGEIPALDAQMSRAIVA